MKDRDDRIDIIKGLAIFCVVLGHIPFIRGSEDELLNIVIYSFHMPCFFLVSGYVSYPSMCNITSYMKFIKIKGRQLLIPFISFSSIVFTFLIISRFFSQGQNPISVSQIGWKVFVESRNVWFLIVLFFVFVLALIGEKIFRFLEAKISFKHIVWIFLVEWIIICLVLPDFIFRFNKLKCFFPFFIIGYLIRKYGFLKSLHKGKIILYLNGILFPILIYQFKYSNSLAIFSSFNIGSISLIDVIIGVVISFSGVGFLILMAMLVHKTRLKQIISSWGFYSLDIYLLHMFFVQILYWIPQTIEDSSYIYHYIYNGVYSVVVILIILFWVKRYGVRMKWYRFITGKK